MTAEQPASFHLPWVKVRGATYVELDSLLVLLSQYESNLHALGACIDATGSVGDLADALAEHGRRAGDHVAWLGVLAGYVADDAPEPEPVRPPGSPTEPAERPPAPEHPSARPSP